MQKNKNKKWWKRSHIFFFLLNIAVQLMNYPLTLSESVEISKDVRLLPLLLEEPHFLLRAGFSLDVSFSSLVPDSSALAVSLLAAVSESNNQLQ